MAKLCACSAKISLPGKRSHVLVIDTSIYERHGHHWCAEIIRGKAPPDGRCTHGQRNTQPTFVNFTQLSGKVKP